MMSDVSQGRQITRQKVIRLVLLSFLLLTTPSIIRTPFAVPGQQKEFLINQGSTLAWITTGTERWTTLSDAPLRSPIHQVVRSQEDAGVYFIAAESGLYVWATGRGAWSQLYAGEVLALAESGSSLLIGTRTGLLRWSGQDQSWQATGQNLPEGTVPVVVRVAPSDRHVVYVSTARHGLFLSHDAGQHFEAINQGLPPALGVGPVTTVLQLLIDPTDADTAYASTEVNGIYKTTDGGRSWQAMTEGLPGLFAYRTYQPLLAFHPHQANTLYAVIGFPVHSHLIENKIYKTTDGGEHWMAISQLPDNTLLRSLTIIGVDPPELALGFDGGVIRVRDEGQQVDGGPYWKPSPRPLRSSAALDMDFGEVAVIEDDGTLNQNFDLHNRTIEFTPTEQPGYTISAGSRSFETELGAMIALADNAALEVPIPFPFRFYGTTFNSVFVNSNGHLTFTRGDPDNRPNTLGSFAQFRLGPPRIAGLWEDFNPAAQGSVHVKPASDPNRLVVTWNNVRLANVPSFIPDSNTFQIVLLADGRIRFNYGRVVLSLGGLVGLSPGNSRASVLAVNWSRDLPQTVDNRAVLEFFTGRGLDIQATARKFYETHADQYEQLVVFSSGLFRTNMTGQVAALAFHAPVQNDVQGIGRPVGNILGGPAAFGSQGRLQSFLNMNRLNFYPDDPRQEIGATITPLDAIGHETAHRWLAYLIYDNNGTPSLNLLQLDFTHWSFFLNSDASLMYGNRWLDREDGTFISVEATTRYGALDEYAMGLRPPEDVPAVFFISQPVDPDGRTRNNLPEVGVTVSGNRTEVSLGQIIAQNGVRLPAFGSSPTSWRQAYVLVIPEGESPVPGEIEKLDRFRRAFEPTFIQLTNRRAAVDTRLSPGQADLVLEASEVNPPMLNPGDAAVVSFTIRNEGTAATGLVVNQVGYSENDEIESSDPVLKKVSTVSLAPGESVGLGGIPVVVPRTATSGSHFITLAIDAGNAAMESNEMNNQVAIPITVLGSGITLVPATETEPNDRMNQATPITPDVVITADFGSSRDVDFYSFSARAGQSLTIDINARSLIPPSTANTVVTLFDSGGIQLAENDDFAGSPDSFLQFIIPRSGQYFFRLRNAAAAPMGARPTYQAVVMLRSAGSATEIEPNDSLETATEITPDVVVSGVLNPTGDQDFYAFLASAGQILSVDVDAQSLIDPSAADTLLSVFDSSGSVIAENDDFAGSNDSFVQVTIPRAGRYFIRVRDVAGRGGPGFTYRAAVRLTSVQQLTSQ